MKKHIACSICLLFGYSVSKKYSKYTKQNTEWRNKIYSSDYSESEKPVYCFSIDQHYNI